MSYRVIWLVVAENQLATAWVDAADRAAVARAAHRIEVLLADSPATRGESRIGTERVLFEPPLVVMYEVIEDDKLVRILGVRLRERPTRG